jgi:hypothetical protein
VALPASLRATLDDYFARDAEWVGAEFGIDLRTD